MKNMKKKAEEQEKKSGEDKTNQSFPQKIVCQKTTDLKNYLVMFKMEWKKFNETKGLKQEKGISTKSFYSKHSLESF